MRNRDNHDDAQSFSSRRSNLSTTVVNTNSARTTPSAPCFAPSLENDVPSQFDSADAYTELDLDNPIPGWPRVAMLMAKTPDFASFSRFRDLNVKSLLYYQAELTRLRKKLHEEELDDALRGDEEAVKYAQRADKLIKSEAPNNRQWELVKEMRVVLKEYSESDDVVDPNLH